VKFTCALMICSLLSVANTLCGQEIVTLSTRAGVIQSYFLARAPQNPQAVAVLFPGSGGLIRLRAEDEQIKFSQNNFLVRSRSEFVKRGIVAAILDAPSDQQSGEGMSDEFRLSEQHFTDVSKVVADLSNRFSGVPIFLVGTSRGTVSAAALTARFDQGAAGAVLTATMFRQTGRKASLPGPGLSKFDFANIKVPLLLVHHVGDQCFNTPYSEAARLSAKYPLITVYGGLPPQSDACEALSTHGFLGKESETVAEIVNWMLKKPFRQEVK
jgi:alpha-beta hydrolase superfamily lysophospholipase